jgi:DNA-binding NtrC family response regulator
MSLGMQVKLLRAIQEKEVCMVGSSRKQIVDVRILSASNKSLASLVENGVFRDDLYYRLNVIPIDLPPLRERADDILLLINHFAMIYANKAGRTVPRFTEKALYVLKTYHWPGNVRELQNLINRLVVMVDGDLLDTPDLPEMMRSNAPREVGFDRTLAEVENDYICHVVESVDGNKTRAAEILGIDRKTLRGKLKRSDKA